MEALAHYRTFIRPLSASIGCYLEDLFVDPRARGRGLATRLLRHLSGLAADQGWSIVRWITAEDNHPARALYDRVAARTRWVTYDMQPATPGNAGHLNTEAPAGSPPASGSG